jgi:alcohol dehydrogenase (cytochrome c)
MAWYFQSSPHDTHDWDATQTPVLFDGTSTASRGSSWRRRAATGWFFVLDRANGKNVRSSEYVKTNWTKGLDAKGQPVPDPAKMPQTDGALVSPNQGGGQNWPPPSFSPQTGLFYANATRAFSVYYLYENEDDEKPQGWGGNDRGGWSEAMLQAIDYKTGKVAWSHKWTNSSAVRSGLLTTAGKRAVRR